MSIIMGNIEINNLHRSSLKSGLQFYYQVVCHFVSLIVNNDYFIALLLVACDWLPHFSYWFNIVFRPGWVSWISGSTNGNGGTHAESWICFLLASTSFGASPASSSLIHSDALLNRHGVTKSRLDWILSSIRLVTVQSIFIVQFGPIFSQIYSIITNRTHLKIIIYKFYSIVLVHYYSVYVSESI